MFLIPVMFIWRKCRTGSDWFDSNVVILHWRERFLKRLNPQPFRLNILPRFGRRGGGSCVRVGSLDPIV